jgi:DNA-binding Xre family transcriptional regulator
MKVKVSYRWHLRQLMAARGMFATSDLVPLLASRGVRLSREQVYRLVARVPERLSLTTLAALCDIFEVDAGELIEAVREAPSSAKKTVAKAPAAVASVSDLRPRRARIVTEAQP